MYFRKNVVSYTVWMIFTMCNCVLFSFMGMLCARVFTISYLAAGIGLVAAFFALLFVIYILTGIVTGMLRKGKEEACGNTGLKKRLIAEGILVVLFLALGVVLRIYMMSAADSNTAYFEMSKVGQDNGELIVLVQNSVYYYLGVLRGLFFLVGNHWIAGIWLQIVLQIAGCGVLYFVIRKMGGICAAVGVLGYLMFAPSNVYAGLSYSPQMLYFLFWSLGLLLVVLYLNASTKIREKEGVGYRIGMWLAVLILGFIVGFLGYVDVSGFLLVLPIMMLPMVFRTVRSKVWIGRMFLGLLAVIGSFAGCIWLDGVLSGASFMRILNAWLTTFQWEIPDVMHLLQESSMEVMILLIIMAMNVFSFFRRSKTEAVTPWILMTLVLAVLYVMGVTTVSMNGRTLLLTLMSVVAAISVRELFTVNEILEPKAEEEEQIIELDQEKPRFIENPLPLPKKHVKRIMDFAFIPEPSQMKYDIEVDDTDDFDV